MRRTHAGEVVPLQHVEELVGERLGDARRLVWEAVEVVGGDSEQTKETRDRLAVRLKKTKCVNIGY